MFSIEVFILVFVCLLWFYKWATKNYNTFKERDIPHIKPRIPLIGNSLQFLKNKESLHKVMLNLYRETKQHKIYGFYNFRTPFFIVNDPELIKKMGVKDFDAFTNHQRLLNMDADPLMGAMLNIMKDKRWKNMRNTMTPIYTSAKMRQMFTLMNECFAESMKYLHAEFNAENSIDIELKECFARLSNDLIATTAFGLKVNSFENKNNEFYAIGQSFANANAKVLQALKFIFYTIAPEIFKLLGLTLFSKADVDYFVRLVVDAIKYREQHQIVRPDMIQLLIETKQQSEQQWSDEELIAQCFIFFFAAYENNANLLCTTCHELMENQHIQDKLYKEIVETHNDLNGKPQDYDALLNMKYLDMVLSESLRKWTLGALTDRECGKDYTVTDEEGRNICQLKQGDRIWFQIIGLHWDAEYFEHPEVFDPERFSEENKHKINPYTYLPFGVGPRSCIGNRYALMQAKAMLYYLLKDFQLERSTKSSTNLMDDIRGFQISPKDGFWFKLVKRNT